MTRSTPAWNRCASSIIRANASSVKTSASVARAAAIASALPARVPPTPPTSASRHAVVASTRSATAADIMP